MRRTALTAIALFCCDLTSIASEPKVDVTQVRTWIDQLDHDRFTVRDTATERLIQAGHASSLQALIITAESGSAEASSRALLVLRNWHRSSDANVRGAVHAAVAKWQKATDPRVVLLGQTVVAKRPSLLPTPPQLPVFG